MVMESRGQRHHRERLGEALREEIIAMVEGELGDPRIGLVNVSEVHLAPDGKSAHVLISVDGGEEEVAQTLEGLSAARGFIRRVIAQRLRLHHAPELVFALDRSQQYGTRIDELLARLRKRQK
jgi:ribosome-binding factor A